MAFSEKKKAELEAKQKVEDEKKRKEDEAKAKLEDEKRIEQLRIEE